MDRLFFRRIGIRDGVDALPADLHAVGRLVPALLVLVSHFRSVPCNTSVKTYRASLEGLGAQGLPGLLRDVRQVRLRVGGSRRRVEGDAAALARHARRR